MIQNPSTNRRAYRINKKHLPYLSSEERAQIIALKNVSRMTNKDIAASLGCSTATVKQVLSAAKSGCLSSKPKSGRPPKITEEIKQKIIGLVEANRRMTPAEVILEIQKDHPTFSCGAQFIRSVLF